MTFRRSAVAISSGVAILLAYVLTKALLTGQYWFHGVDQWGLLFRPFPEWGTGAALYGALLASKWIGTRTLGAAVGMFAAVSMGFALSAYRIPALLACEAAAIELGDALWLAIGKTQGWSTAATVPTTTTELVWAALLLAAAGLLWGGEPPRLRPAPVATGSFAPAPLLDRVFIWLCYAVAIAYVGMKLLFAWWWYADSIWFWLAAFRPFPDWGTGADLFGAILPARMIGTRNLAFGLLILFAVGWAAKRREHRLLGLLLLQGAVIEFLDGFWLAYGKYDAGWVGQNTDFFMKGGFYWVPDLMLAGIYCLGHDRRHAATPAP